MNKTNNLVDGQDIIDVVTSSKEYPTKTNMYAVSSVRGYDDATFRLAVRDWWDDIWERSPYRSKNCKLNGGLLTRTGYRLLRRAEKNPPKRKPVAPPPSEVSQPKPKTKPKAKAPRTARKAIAQRGGFTLADMMMDQACLCACCGCDLISSSNYELDHIQPISKGGCDEFWNLQFLCRPCNASKKDADPFQWSARTHTPLPKKFLARFK